MVGDTTKGMRLALFWRNLGPYHVSRARAAARLLEPQGFALTVMEIADSEQSRDWTLDRNQLPVNLCTIAPGAALGETTRSMVRQTRQTLDDLNPTHLAVAGYDRPEMREALQWGRRHGRIVVLMSETKWDDRSRSWWKRLLASRIVSRADAALVSGTPSGEYLVSLGMPREFIFRQYGTIENELFQRASVQAASEPGLADFPVDYFLVVCRLIEERKNVKRLLEAFAEYRRGGGQWDLLISGDGQDKAMLEDYARRLDVAGVHFVGFQQVDVLARCYGHARCLIHPAINEAWGLVVNEAMAAGLPVLLSRRCGCAADLIHENVNGFTFNPYDVEELCDMLMRMEHLGEDRRCEMGRASQGIIARWGPEAFAAGLSSAIHAAERRRLTIRDGQS